MANELVDGPASAIKRIKSAKALAALAKLEQANGGGDAAVVREYRRGVKGQLEDQDRLAKLDWTQVGSCSSSILPQLILPQPAVAPLVAAFHRSPSVSPPNTVVNRVPLQEMLAQPGAQTLLTCGAMSKVPDAGSVNAIDADHLFLSLLKQDMVRDLLFLWNTQDQAFHTLISIGLDVCGHPSIVHGGFTSGGRRQFTAATCSCPINSIAARTAAGPLGRYCLPCGPVLDVVAGCVPVPHPPADPRMPGLPFCFLFLSGCCSAD
jgi:hypothetical protein